MLSSLFFFFFNDTATTEIYTLSLHDALPISDGFGYVYGDGRYWKFPQVGIVEIGDDVEIDRKSTRLNSSHANISYAVFCLKKKKKESEHIKVKYHLGIVPHIGMTLKLASRAV